MNKKTIQQITIAIILIGSVASYIFKSCSNQKSDNAGTQQQGTRNQIQGKPLAEQNSLNPDIHILLGTPVSSSQKNIYVLRQNQYVVGYNTTKNNPDWVSWNLSAYWYGDVERTKGQFQPNPDLPRGMYRVTHRDYTGSGFDRGHMVRSEERTRTVDDNKSTFLTTNLLPQYHELNAGPWLRLEELCERLCKRSNKELFVIAGPIYSKDLGTIGNGVAVPSECFKIIVVLEAGQQLLNINENTRIIAVRMPNSQDIQTRNWRDYETTVRAIEEATNYNFLDALPKELQDKLETVTSRGTSVM